MRSHRRRQPIEHALVAGDVGDLPGIVTALAWLPADTYGQVFIEVGPDEELPLLAAPPRMTVHRLERSSAGDGVAAGRAVAAWAGEWIPDEPDERRTVTIWVGERVDLSCPEIMGLAERL
ncbi:MAG: SIP domain-containing protein [Aeromicrobium sp.]